MNQINATNGTNGNGNGNNGSASAMVGHGVVAVESTGGGSAGAIVWWRLAGGLPLVALAAAWTAEGLDAKELPTVPAPGAALRRACMDLATATRIAKPLPGRAGWGVYDRSGDGDAYTITVKATLRADDSVSYDPAWHVDAGRIEAAYQAHSQTVNAQDVSLWITRLVYTCDGAALRDTGGVYYVPPHGIDRWERIVRALRACGSTHAIHYAPAMRSGDAIAGFLDAIAHEAEVEAGQMEAEITGGKLGERALASRLVRIGEIEAKIGRYASALGVDMAIAEVEASGGEGAILADGALARIASRLVDLRQTASIAIGEIEAAKQAAGATGAA